MGPGELLHGETSSHSILTIPPELLERIAQEAEPQDLLSLRLVSKETNQKVFRTFLNVHFTERAFLLSSLESLQTLLSISKNEPFARSLRRIDLLIEEIPARDHWIHQNAAPRMELTKFQTAELDIKAEKDSTWDKIVSAQKAIRKCNFDLHVLTVAFAHLRDWQNLKEIRVVDCAEACEIPQGFNALEKLSDQTMFAREDTKRVVPLVMDALAMSLLQIESLCVHFDNYYIDFIALVNEPLAFRNTVTTFTQLKKLHLQLDHTSVPPTIEDVDRFFEALGTANVIEDLSLDLWDGYPLTAYPEIYERMVRCIRQCLKIRFPELKYLELQGFDIRCKDLKDITFHIKKLSGLHFHGKTYRCRIDERGHHLIRRGDSHGNGHVVTHSRVVHGLSNWKEEYSVDVASCTMMEWLMQNQV